VDLAECYHQSRWRCSGSESNRAVAIQSPVLAVALNAEGALWRRALAWMYDMRPEGAMLRLFVC